MTSPRRGDARALVLLSATAFLAYGGTRIAELGFYRDDWSVLRIMSSAHSKADALSLLARQGFLIRRPVDVLLAAVPYWLFGLRPLGWQINLAALNALGAYAIFRLLRLFRTSEAASVLAAAAFLAYPSKDTALFWAGYVNGPLALLCFLAAYIWHLEFVEDGRAWKLAAACSAVAVCFGSYDSCLFLLPVLAVAPRPTLGVQRLRQVRSFLLLSATTAAVMAARWLIIRSLAIPSYVHHSLSHAVAVYAAGINANFGPDLILATLLSLRRAFERAPLVAVSAVAAPLLAAGLLSTDQDDERSGRALLRLGAAVFVLGLLPLAISPYMPAPTAEENRLNLVPAAGIALALGGWLGTRLRGRAAVRAAALAVGALIAASAGSAASWAEAYRRQLALRDLVLERRSAWPREDALVLRIPELHVDGRASVFDHETLLAPALSLWTGDPAPSVYLLRPGLEFRPEGLSVDGVVKVPYDRMFFLDAATGTSNSRPDYRTMRTVPIPENVHNPFAAALRRLLSPRPSSAILGTMRSTMDSKG